MFISDFDKPKKNLNEGTLHTKYKRNRFKSLEKRRREEETLLRKAMRHVKDEHGYIDEDGIEYEPKDPRSYNDDDFYAFDPETKVIKSTWTHKDVGRRHSEYTAQQNGWQVVSGMRAKGLELLTRKRPGMAEGSLEEYGDTARGQKMLTRVQKRAVDRAIKADDKRDPKAAKKNADTANRAWERMSDKDLEEGLNEFAPPGSNDGGNDGFSEETLKRLAAQWYNGDEDPRVERTLMAAGWEIGQDEGYDDEPGVFVVQSGDVNGSSYISWPAHELKQGMAEGYGRNRGYEPGFASPHAPNLGGRREREDDEGWDREEREQSQNWYIRINGKILKDKMQHPYTFRGKAAAEKAARTMMSKSFNQGKKFTLTTSWMDAPEQGVGEGAGSMTVGMKSSHKSFKPNHELDEAVERAAQSMAEDGYEFAEEKVRLDPKCWKGKKIGNPKTKMKGGVRVNNCVPAESIEEENKGLYYNVNKRKKAGTSRDKDHPKAPTAQAWKDAAKTAKKT